MRVPCAGKGCSERRIHFEHPNTPRGVQLVEVPEGHEDLVFCSIECWLYGPEEMEN